jgi:hypothetical protein
VQQSARPQPSSGSRPERRPPRTQTTTKKETKSVTGRVAAANENIRRAASSALGAFGHARAGSRETTLLVGGLALLLFVLCETVLLTVSTRTIRRSGRPRR